MTLWKRLARDAFLLSAATVALTAPSISATDAPTSPGLDVYAQPQRLVKLPDGRRMNIYCLGTGSPTVILEGGWTTDTLAMRGMQAPIAAFTRVCSYDRAGWGFSDPGPLPRTAKAIAHDLDALLRAATVPGPYLLVGHSSGGMYARMFANLYPQEVVGMLLAEPTTEFGIVRMAKVSPLYAQSLKDWMSAVDTCAKTVIAGTMKDDTPGRDNCLRWPDDELPPAVNAVRQARQKTPAFQTTLDSEVQTLMTLSSSQVAKSTRSYGDMPLMVLTGEISVDDAAISPEEQAARRKVWWDMHEEIARLSSHGVHRLVPGAAHVFPWQGKAEVVVNAVKELVVQIRAASVSN
jgi:pimeloyl-ACP methyl ester carboxylesterase